MKYYKRKTYLNNCIKRKNRFKRLMVKETEKQKTTQLKKKCSSKNGKNTKETKKYYQNSV